MKVVIGDGAEWIWNLAHQHFPDAVQIVDLYPARQHLWSWHACSIPPTASARTPGSVSTRNAGWTRARSANWSVRCAQSASQILNLAAKISNQADYFANNTVRMNYPRFRKHHLFVGSGVIEAGCKTVIGHRLQQSGMFWTGEGSQRYPRPPLLSPQRPLRGLLGAAPGRLSSTSISRTLYAPS